MQDITIRRLNILQVVGLVIKIYPSLDTECKLNVHKTFCRCLKRSVYVLCPGDRTISFNLTSNFQTETLTQVFSCEFCKILRTLFLQDTSGGCFSSKSLNWRLIVLFIHFNSLNLEILVFYFLWNKNNKCLFSIYIYIPLVR